MEKAVVCILDNRPLAEDVVAQLRTAGFTNDRISVLLPDKRGTKDFAHEQNTKAPEGATAGASAGGILGGALGWLVGIGTVAIPGVGPFIAAGPILAALSGTAVGATVGGITGALIGMGIPELEAKQYQGKITGSNILLSVHTDDSEERELAKDIFQKAGAKDIRTIGEANAPTRSRATPV